MYFVSDSDGRIYKEGTEDECKAFLSTPSEIIDNLPPMSIYAAEDWSNLFGASEE